MSPDLNMDVKWAYYNEGQTTFSCVCDGNSKVTDMSVSLFWTDYTSNKTYKYDVPSSDVNESQKNNSYPINFLGEYYSFELNANMNNDISGTDEEGKSVSLKNKLVNAKFTLQAEDGTNVYNYASFYLKEKPTLSITRKAEEEKFIGEYDAGEVSGQAIFCQYFFWEIYYNDKLIYKTDKIFSQDIALKYDGFENEKKYLIKCTVVSNIGETTTENYEFTSQYKATPLTTQILSKTRHREAGVLFNWSSENIISGHIYSADGIDKSKFAKNFIVSSDEIFKLYEENIEFTSSSLSLEEHDTFSIKNINLSNDNNIYWSGYIHLGKHNFGNDNNIPILTVKYEDESAVEKTVSIVKTNDKKLYVASSESHELKENWYTEDDVIISNFRYVKGACQWCIIELNIISQVCRIQLYDLEGVSYPILDSNEETGFDENGLLTLGEEYWVKHSFN
jgi:hypothetical protein